MEDEERKIKLTNDYVFKKIFGQKGNEKITEGFIGSVIGKKVDIKTLSEDRTLEKDLKDDKMGILDVRASLENGTVCDIEMQVLRYADIEKRIMFYWSKLYLEKIKEGNRYEKLNKVIIILVTEYELDITKDIKKYHTKWEIREEENYKKVLTEVLEINIIELSKMRKMMKENKMENKKDKLALWVKFILFPDEVEERELEENEDIKQAKEEYDKLMEDPRERQLAEWRQQRIMDEHAIRKGGYLDGKEEGIEQGKTEEKTEVAKRLLKMNLPIEQIIEITELTEEEINKLR